MRATIASQLRWEKVYGFPVRVCIRPGTEPGPPLVLCNGIGASLELLQPFVDAVDQRVEVITFDVPGVGSSPAPRFPYTFAALAALVGKLVTQVGHDRFDVLGISWGGGLAQQIAFQYPRRCGRMVLVATGTGALMIPAHPRVLARLATPRRYRDRDYARRVAAELYGGVIRDDPEAASRLMHEHSRVGSRRGYLFQMMAGAAWTSLPALPFIGQPTMILAGSDDPIIPIANARIMAQLMPHAELHIYDDGHLGLITQAETLGPLVSRFLRPG